MRAIASGAIVVSWRAPGERENAMLNAFSCFFDRMGSGKKNDPMAFLDEYAAVMNRHARVKVRNSFKWGRASLSIDVGIDGLMLWLDDGRYCFDEEERGQVRTQGFSIRRRWSSLKR